MGTAVIGITSFLSELNRLTYGHVKPKFIDKQ